MSFPVFVRSVESKARDLGIRLPMAKLRDAIAKAIYDQPYSVSVANDRAGSLPAISLPPKHLRKVADAYGLDPDIFASAFPAGNDTLVEFEAFLATLDRLIEAPPAEAQRKRAVERHIGYRRRSLWSPTLPLPRPCDLTRLIDLMGRSDSLVEALGPAALNALHGVMDETVVSIAYDLVPNESRFLQLLRTHVALQYQPVPTTLLTPLIGAQQLLRRHNAISGTDELVLPLVKLPLAGSPQVPMLYDVILDATTYDFTPEVPLDRRPLEARGIELTHGSISPEQRQQGQLSNTTLAHLEDTVTLVTLSTFDHPPPTSEQLFSAYQSDPHSAGLWSIHEDVSPSPGAASYFIHADFPPKLDDGFPLGPFGIGTSLSASDLRSFPLALLGESSLHMTRREASVFAFVFGYDGSLAVRMAAAMRLIGSAQNTPRVPQCYPMLCSVRIGSTLSPAIVIGISEYVVDAIVFAPCLLADVRRMVVSIDAVREGKDAFGSALRAKARRLQYDLDDTQGPDHTLATTFWEAKAFWQEPAFDPLAFPPPIHFAVSRWNHEVENVSNHLACLQLCLDHLAIAPVHPDHLLPHADPSFMDAWDDCKSLKGVFRAVLEDPLNPSAWFEGIMCLARSSNDPRHTERGLTASIEQIRRGLGCARHWNMDEAFHSLLYCAGRILDQAAMQDDVRLLSRLARNLLADPGPWRHQSPVYFETPWHFTFKTELEVFVCAADAALGKHQKAAATVAKLSRQNSESVDLRVLALGVAAIQGSEFQRRAYVNAFREVDSEAVGFLRDWMREMIADEDEYDWSARSWAASSLHVPMAVAHAVVLELDRELKLAVIRAVRRG